MPAVLFAASRAANLPSRTWLSSDSSGSEAPPPTTPKDWLTPPDVPQVAAPSFATSVPVSGLASSKLLKFHRATTAPSREKTTQKPRTKQHAIWMCLFAIIYPGGLLAEAAD